MPVQRATTINEEAYLNSAFGRSFVQSRLGLDNQMIEALVGRYIRGKRKGQLRGTVIFKKTTVGGWSRQINGVRRPGIIEDSIEIWINYHSLSAKRVL